MCHASAIRFMTKRTIFVTTITLAWLAICAISAARVSVKTPPFAAINEEKETKRYENRTRVTGISG
jgi:hypothetical protein